MAKKLATLTLLLSALVASSGCCCLDQLICRWEASKRARTWCGNGCGEKYCCEWFSDPPVCCDPCNRCGDYVGSRGHHHGMPPYGPPGPGYGGYMPGDGDVIYDGE